MMREHPIEGLMSSAMSNIQEMVDVNTIIGDPIETNQNIVIIPISKVCFGFAAGGSEFNEETIDEYNKREKEEMIQYKLPFGGGSGAGVSINPIAFLIVQNETVKLLPVNHSSSIDKLLDYVPDLFQKVGNLINNNVNSNSKEDLEKIIKDSSKEKDKRKEKNDKFTYGFENNELEEDD